MFPNDFFVNLTNLILTVEDDWWFYLCLHGIYEIDIWMSNTTFRTNTSMPKWKMYSTKISMWWRQWLWRQVWWTKLQREQVNHFFFAFNLRGLSGVYYYWGKVGRMMEMTANHIMYWSDCHWHFVKMSQMQIFYTKSCNLCQARTRLDTGMYPQGRSVWPRLHLSFQIP